MFVLPLQDETDEQYAARVREAADMFYGKPPQRRVDDRQSRSADCNPSAGIVSKKTVTGKTDGKA